MKKITGQKKYQFENQIDSLFDLFLLISREIDTDEILMEEKEYFIKKRSLAVSLCIHKNEEIQKETLIIRKEWKSNCVEEFTYISEMEDPVLYSQRDSNFLNKVLSDKPELLDEINQVRSAENLPLYKNGMEFIEDIEFVQVPHCYINYHTDHIGRGLETLASLRMSSSSDNRADAVLGIIFEKMQFDDDVQKELIRKYGKTNTKQHVKMIRAGKITCSKDFRITLDDTAPPYVLGFRLLELCEYYLEVD